MASYERNIMMKAKQIMKEVHGKIRATKKDSYLTTLKTYIEEAISNMDKIAEDKKRKKNIGIFGKSGEGKSSLLNAILGKEDLLPSGCFGACTTVMCQVEANLSDSNYIAEIDLFSKEEWEHELSDLVSVLENQSDDSDEDMTEIAKEKITALYGADAESQLQELKKVDKFTEVEKTISTCDISDFANKVANYIQHSVSSPGGWYWPLVKRVTIKIPNCTELLEHIVLVDLPGTGDCNKIRDEMWKSKLKDCSSVWIVSDIQRAITDRDPWGILNHCIQELEPGGECKYINFICTKTDIINPTTYQRSERLTIQQISRDKQATECILHRNNCAKESVKRKFRLMEKFTMDVFTVSSKAFFKQSLNLNLTETEIPALQDVLKDFNRRINRELTSDYISEAKGVLSLIQSFQPDTDKKTVETKAEIHKELEKNLQKALIELDGQFGIIHDILEKCLSKGVEESVELAVTTAQQELIEPRDTDRRGYHKILQALCKNRGCYWSKNWDTILDLNKCLATHMYRNIYEEFRLIFPVSAITEKSVQEQINKFSIFQSDNTYPRSSMLHHIQNFIIAQESRLKGSLSRDVISAKKKIYSSIQTTIQEKMDPYYERAANKKGKGSMKKRQEILTEGIEALKQDMFNEAKAEILKQFNNLKLQIKDALECELKKSMNLLLLRTNNLLDVSREIEELEGLTKEPIN